MVNALALDIGHDFKIFRCMMPAKQENYVYPVNATVILPNLIRLVLMFQILPSIF